MERRLKSNTESNGDIMSRQAADLLQRDCATRYVS